MKPYFENTCHKCGTIAELDFRYAGPHIKAVCSGCGFYVKFFDKGLIPDVRDIKMRILTLADGNLEAIEKHKTDLGLFYPGITGLDAKIAYWKLYLKLI